MKPLAKDEDYRQMQEWENWVVINMRGDNESDAKHLVTYLIPGCPLFRDGTNHLRRSSYHNLACNR